MVNETRKIMGDDSIDVCPTCVRVPVLNSHSESILIETERPITPEAAREVWSKAPGLVVVDDPARREYPLPAAATDRDEVFVGRIRQDLHRPTPCSSGASPTTSAREPPPTPSRSPRSCSSSRRWGRTNPGRSRTKPAPCGTSSSS